MTRPQRRVSDFNLPPKKRHRLPRMSAPLPVSDDPEDYRRASGEEDVPERGNHHP